MLAILERIRKKAVIGFVGGSNLVKISEQLAVDGGNGTSIVIITYLRSSSNY
jgi:hypothetical protein